MTGLIRNITSSAKSLLRMAAVAASALIMFCPGAGAQDAPRIYFRVGQSKLDRSTRENARALARLDDILLNHEEYTVDSVLVVSMSSPEGPTPLNNTLSLRRAEVVRDYIVSTYPHLAGRVGVSSEGEAWEELRAMVASDEGLADASRDRILGILDSDASGAVKEQRMRALPEFRYIADNILPKLRVSVFIRTAISINLDLFDPSDTDNDEPLEIAMEPLNISESPLDIAPMVLDREVKMAVKTNLVYDLAATPNLSLEFPIKKGRFSAGVNYEFPWFVWGGNSRCWEILHAEPFFRVWPGSRKSRPALTGLYIGAVAGLGYYDIEPHHKGWQGEAVNAGVEAGYAWAFGKDRRWRFETGAGFGWMRTQYSNYEGNEGDKHLLWQRDGRYSWLGPVKVSASISYVIFNNSKKRRGGR